eukprot:TRINITY_DN2799_c0_g1_i37.p1 TRINITY_DN2799_c0_g1~~TRINITY_DN2799_c0_g1_i37.p1  ORF type:complete len:418 (+),score=47.86 TRINITY_DN2799_c0_g1_i37:61-1314(+)
MQVPKEGDLSKMFRFGPLRGRPECWYEHIPQCQDDPNCFRSACGYCHPERDSRNTRWTWVYPSERNPQPQYPQRYPQQHQQSSQPSHNPKEIKSKSEAPLNLDIVDGPRPYNPWSFNSTDLTKDFSSPLIQRSDLAIQRPARFSSALKIESPREIEKQQFFAQQIVDEVVQDKQEKVAVAPQEKEKEKVAPQKEVQVEAAQAQPAAGIAETNLATTLSEKVSTTVPKNELPSAPKAASALIGINRAEIHFKSKAFQPLSHVSSEATKQLRIRKLVGHGHEPEPGRVQFSLKGGSSDTKLSKPSQPSHLEKTHRLDAPKKESSSQSLDTDASPPIAQEQGWLEMFILLWFTCGKKLRMLLVAICALFAVIFHRIVPKGSRSPDSARTSKSVSDRKSGSAGMPRPISYAVFCLKKKKKT